VKCEKALNALYSKIIHVTYDAHELHRVAEEVRSQYESVDQLISNIKKYLEKLHLASFFLKWRHRIYL